MIADLYGRRLRHEWELLTALAVANPGRLTELMAAANTFTLHLHGPAALQCGTEPPCPMALHAVRIHFPVHFPAVPMELFLARPAVHPNIHPDTGFVCLWSRHRVSNTVEHALHKLVAMLAGDLYSADPHHVMQSGALDVMQRPALKPMPLLGLQYDAVPAAVETVGRRQRLQ